MCGVWIRFCCKVKMSGNFLYTPFNCCLDRRQSGTIWKHFPICIFFNNSYHLNAIHSCLVANRIELSAGFKLASSHHIDIQIDVHLFYI